VLPEKTEAIFQVLQIQSPTPVELTDVLDRAKKRAAKIMLQRSPDTRPPFYDESFDRIIRDDAEYEALWEAILMAPVNHELVEDPESYGGLYVRYAPG
jgi:hypothetical protein